MIGHLADWISLRFFVILSPAVTGAAMSLLGVTPRYGLLALLLLIAGISSASLHAVGTAMIGDRSQRRLGRNLGIWMVGGELGRTLGPLVVVAALGVLSPDGMAWLMLGGLMASGLLYLRLPAVPARPRADQRHSWREAARAMLPLLIPLVGVITARAVALAAAPAAPPDRLCDPCRDAGRHGTGPGELSGQSCPGQWCLHVTQLPPALDAKRQCKVGSG